MKKFISLIVLIAVFLALCCLGIYLFYTSLNSQEDNISIVPQIGQMRSICELAVMECYYNNVAKYYEEDAEGMLFWKKDKQFWIEYSGRIKIGVDVSLVSFTIKEDILTITLPPAKVLSSSVDETTFTSESFIIANNSATIDASDQVSALAEAQVKIEQEISSNRTLLASAQQRAQYLLEDYVNNIAELMGTTYQIEWVYL